MQKRLHNYLRTYRRRLGLSQKDAAFLLGGRGKEKISRHERGVREPVLETLIAYSILYDVSLADIYSRLCERQRKAILKQIKAMLQDTPENRENELKRASLTRLADRLKSNNQ
ncbi:helix-turn-helix transcriptional regulator [candidate division KSB1 bacterium]|nr:helix-turn-helix transcriptional regulator [candidate division KSB1 bacterium]